MRPESDELLRAIPKLKETLNINVELASPDQFMPFHQIGKTEVHWYRGLGD
jgi:hypothetical protein